MLESLFSKVAGLQLYEKETPTPVFSCKYCEMVKNTFLTGHLWTAASEPNLLFVSALV